MRIDLPDAEVDWWPAWLAAAAALRLHQRLCATIPWQVHRIRLFGRWVDAPRLSCWIGDPQAVYRYSGARFRPHPWTSELAALRARLQAATGARFNSVLLNRYRDGADAIGWHSDDEPELGPAPLIASLSLGAPRRFLLRRRDDHALRRSLLLASGDLLLMGGRTQALYQHALPRTARPVGERLNLTFRWIAG